MSELKKEYTDKKWMIDRLDKLEFDLTMLRNMTPFGAINYIRQGICYDDFLKEYAQFRRMKVEDLYEIENELAGSAKEFSNYQEWFDYIEEYGKELEEQAKKNKKIQNAVTISTMHSAKGLEYEIVYVIDAVEGVTPHHKAVLDEDIEEERRLFYVATTRAKNQLHICWIKERFNKPVTKSRFVGEMMNDVSEVKKGIYVIHRKYGEGKVREVSGGKACIYFPNVRKELVFDIKYAVLNGIIKVKDS